MKRRARPTGYIFKPATTEQLLTLDSLHREQIYFRRFLNRPRSAVTSIIIFPTLMHFLFFQENGLLRGVYEGIISFFGDSLFEKRHTQLTEIGLKLNEAVKGLVADSEGMKLLYLEICRRAGMVVNMEQVNDCYQYIDELMPSNQLLDIKKQFINYLKNSIEPWDLTVMKTMEATEVIDIFHKLNPHKDSFQSIMLAFGNAVKILTDRLTATATIMQSERIKTLVAINAVENGMDRTFFFYQLMTILVGILGQNYVLDPLLFKFSNGRLISYNPLKPYLKFQRDTRDATQEIADQTSQLVVLKKRAHFHKKIARYVLLFWVVLMAGASLFLTSQDISSTVALSFLAVFSTALKDGFQDFRAWRQSMTLQSDIKHCLNLLGHVTQNINQSNWQCNQGQQISSSYFYIDLQNSVRLGLKGKFIARRLEYYLKQEGVVTLHSRNERVIVPSTPSLTAGNLKKTAANFALALQRLSHIKELRTQLVRIMKSLECRPDVEVTSFQDEKNLPTARFYLNMSGSHFAFSTLEQALLQIGNALTIESSFAVVDGYSAFYKIPDIKLPPRSMTTGGLTETLANRSPHIPRRHTTQKHQATHSIPEQKEEEKTQPSAAIHWGEDSFDPQDLDGLVRPMRTTFPSHGRYFVTFKLEPHHFPRDYPSELYKKLKESVLRGKIGADEQGWKVIAAHLCDDLTTGENQVPASAKFRTFGLFGDLRLYARSTTARTADGDKILYRVVGLDLHAH